ncbi:TnsA endonuclease N-terminal domain-containing protein [Ralstonia mannitolilytica]|uniref:TnsA endonuclease N-terminal domain-containing protein n=1 Tax=Ralstonia mannitolilytica TaxID=105219 RepID=UPI0013DDEF03|nr:heteromeric transposase endonuclease subunit TnsA [Ralstonia mannitolilytica]
MPVRRIPKNYLFVTGRHPSPLADEVIEFESILEKEYMLLLDSDPQVESYDCQPVKIPLSRGRVYVPDLLVTYRCSPSGNQRSPELVEIKKQEYLDRHAETYREKFAAATVFAEERGWVFITRTEIDIRTQHVQNLKFLHRYRHTPADPVAVERLLAAMRRLDSPTTPDTLLGSLADTLEMRAGLIPVLWHLVAHGEIQADLQIPLTDSTQLFLPS